MGSAFCFQSVTIAAVSCSIYQSQRSFLYSNTSSKAVSSSSDSRVMRAPFQLKCHGHRAFAGLPQFLGILCRLLFLVLNPAISVTFFLLATAKLFPLCHLSVATAKLFSLCHLLSDSHCGQTLPFLPLLCLLLLPSCVLFRALAQDMLQI